MNEYEARELAAAARKEAKPEMDIDVVPVYGVRIFDPLSGRERIIQSPDHWERTKNLPVGLAGMAARTREEHPL